MLPWQCATIVQNRNRAGRRDVNSKLGQVPLEEGLDELPAPGMAVVVRSCQKRQRKSSTLPVPHERFRAYLGESQTCDEDGFQTAGKGLRGLMEQLRRGAAENEESRRQGVAVG